MDWAVALSVISLLRSISAGLPDLPGLEYLNTDIDPCEDFYEFTCGNFNNANSRPPNEPIWDHFTILQNEINEMAREILSSPRRAEEPQALQKAKAFYASCLDTNYADQLGARQIDVFNSIGEWPAISDRFDQSQPKLTWIQLAAISAKYGLQFFLKCHALPALLDPKQNAIYIDTDRLDIPKASACRPVFDEGNLSDYLNLEDVEVGANETSPYLNFLNQIAVRLRDLTNQHKPARLVNRELQDTIEFMRKVAENGIPPDPNTTLTFILEAPVESLQRWTNTYFGDSFINWIAYFNTLLEPSGLKVTKRTKVIVANAAKFYGILNLYRNATSRQLRDYVMARVLTHLAPDGDEFMRRKWTEYAKVARRTTHSRPEYCLQKTIGSGGTVEFSLAVTHEYQKYHFDANKLEKAAAMVRNLQTTFLDMLAHSCWMDATSAERARKKALKMITLLGYPPVAEDALDLNSYYDKLRVCTWDHFGNAQRFRVFSMLDSLKDIGHMKLRTEWNRSPLEVNAFYHQANNRILFPISVLNPIFFRGDYSVFDYSRIGAIIGHEITHGFDASGSAFNEDGVVGGIWTMDTKKAFNERKQCFQKQYSKYFVPETGAFVNGTATVNENLADNGGLRMAYQSFLQVLNTADNYLPQGTGFTPEQLFFIGFGTMWCMQESPEYLAKLAAAGSYAPGRFRVRGAVSNMPEFAAAFECPLGSNMNPKDKCVMW